MRLVYTVLSSSFQARAGTSHRREFRTSDVLGGTAGHSSKNRYCPARFGTVDRYGYITVLAGPLLCDWLRMRMRIWWWRAYGVSWRPAAATISRRTVAAGTALKTMASGANSQPLQVVDLPPLLTSRPYRSFSPSALLVFLRSFQQVLTKFAFFSAYFAFLFCSIFLPILLYKCTYFAFYCTQFSCRYVLRSSQVCRQLSLETINHWLRIQKRKHSQAINVDNSWPKLRTFRGGKVDL